MRAPFKESDMRWEVPTAIEMRFGMEITMYIARR
ncbi:MAG: pyrroloquinoline quinone precursor peptide PqqA [Proteobacteria bacterium]|nr:pyrroloquinoline quinone precursor peptide PqqA [Pseudomonadota bacterium]